MDITQKVQERILSGIADEENRTYIERVLYELSEEILSNGIYSERELLESVSRDTPRFSPGGQADHRPTRI